MPKLIGAIKYQGEIYPKGANTPKGMDKETMASLKENGLVASKPTAAKETTVKVDPKPPVDPKTDDDTLEDIGISAENTKEEIIAFAKDLDLELDPTLLADEMIVIIREKMTTEE